MYVGGRVCVGGGQQQTKAVLDWFLRFSSNLFCFLSADLQRHQVDASAPRAVQKVQHPRRQTGQQRF